MSHSHFLRSVSKRTVLRSAEGSIRWNGNLSPATALPSALVSASASRAWSKAGPLERFSQSTSTNADRPGPDERYQKKRSPPNQWGSRVRLYAVPRARAMESARTYASRSAPGVGWKGSLACAASVRAAISDRPRVVRVMTMVPLRSYLPGLPSSALDLRDLGVCVSPSPRPPAPTSRFPHASAGSAVEASEGSPDLRGASLSLDS